MKSKDQTLLEEAYQMVREGDQFDPRLNKADVSNRPDHSAYKEPTSLPPKRRDPENYKYDAPHRTPSSSAPVDKPYQNRIGQWFIKLSPGNELNLEPRTYSLNKTIVSDNGKTEFELRWNKEQNKLEKIELGAHKLDRELTQWGVKNVPGGDID